jgi:deferrochelatase/peroxidase EfeB
MSTLTRPKATAPADIQKLVTSGYRFERSRHLVLTVQDAVHARRFLKKLCDDGWLVPAQESWGGAAGQDRLAQRFGAERCPLSLGLTFAGLKKLELDERLLGVLHAQAPAFAQGAWVRASDQLGDIGASAPAEWETSFLPATAHLLLILHANTEDTLNAAEQSLSAIAGDKAFASGWCRHDAAHLTTDPAQRRVHFGMIDGLSQPAILPEPPGPEDLPDRVHNRHRLGEFVLGYDNDDRVNPWRLATERPASSRVPPAEQSRTLADFFKNGSFAAFRKMAQDEPLFRTFVQEQAETLRGTYKLEEAEAFIRAKLLGRWDDGHLVQPDDTMARRASAVAGMPPADGSFDFANDQAGQGCPFGAHIRRMNPRNDPVVPFRRRPILRRGMPYGAPYQRDDCENDGQNRGLIGLFFCASLEDQFEHLVGQWANDTPMGPNNRGNARDPLIGHNNSNLHVYDIPLSDTAALALRGLKPFVTTKGTLYAFFPSLSAVKQLADPPPPDDGTNRSYPCETGLKSP